MHTLVLGKMASWRVAVQRTPAKPNMTCQIAWRLYFSPYCFIGWGRVGWGKVGGWSWPAAHHNFILPSTSIYERTIRQYAT